MCQAIADGGRRCPRHRRDSIVALQVAALSTGLSMSAIASMFTDLRREGRHVNYVNAEARYRELITTLRQQVSALSLGAQYERILDDYDQDELPSGDTLYALTKIHEKSLRASFSLDAEMDELAMQYGQDEARVRARYQELLQEVGNVSEGTEDEDYTAENQQSAHIAGVPKDPATVIALARLRRQYSTLPERAKRFTEEDYFPVFRGEHFTAAYDPSDGYLQLRGDRIILSYRDLPQGVMDKWQESGYSMGFYVQQIRTPGAYQYASAAEAERDSYNYKCADCGQYRALIHSCPADTPIEGIEDSPISVNEALHFQTHATPLPDLPRTAIPEDALREKDENLSFELSSQEVAALSDVGINYIRYVDATYAIQKMEEEVSIHSIEEDYISYADGSMRLKELRELPEGTKVLYGENESGVSAYYISHPLDPLKGAPPRGYLTIPISRRPLEISVLKLGIVDTDRVFTEESHLVVAAREMNRYNASTAGDVYVATSMGSESFRFTIRQGATSKIKWARPSDFRRGFSDHAVVESDLVWVEAGRGAAPIDEMGYEVGSRLFRVEGKLAIRQHEDGRFQTVSPRSALRCSCDAYKRNYHCIHIDYVHNHAPKVAHQLSTSELEKHLARGEATESTNERTGQRIVKFTGEGELETLPVHARREIWEDETNGVVLSALNAVAESRVKINNMEAISEALETAGQVVIPFTAERMGDPVAASYDFGMEGEFVYSRNDDGDMMRQVANLRCSCGRFTSPSSPCAHVDLIQRHHALLFQPLQEGSEEGWSAGEASDRLWDGLSPRLMDAGVNQNLRAWEMVSGRGIPFEEAQRAIEKEEAAQRRRREELLRTEVQAQIERMKKDLEYYISQDNSQEYSDYWDDQKNRWQNVDERYEDNTEAVKSLIQETQTHNRRRSGALKYRTENVTDGVCDPSIPGSRRFGVELEFTFPEGVDADAANALIAKDLHEAGLSDSPNLHGYHAGRSTGWPSWSLEEDSTVDGELVSPLMADTPEHWAQLQQAVEILKRHGATPSQRAGSHVHVSSGSFGGKLAKDVEVLRTIKDHEDVLYRAASDPSTGSHRGTEWCYPNVSTAHYGDVGQDVYNTYASNDIHWDPWVGVLEEHMGHNNSVNFTDSTGASDQSHIEYRLWDSSLDAATIQRQIVTSVALTETADRHVRESEGASYERKASDTSTWGSAGKRIGKSGTSDVDDEAVRNLTSFVDRVFRRKEDREDFIRLYAMNKNPGY